MRRDHPRTAFLRSSPAYGTKPLKKYRIGRDAFDGQSFAVNDDLEGCGKADIGPMIRPRPIKIRQASALMLSAILGGQIVLQWFE